MLFPFIFQAIPYGALFAECLYKLVCRHLFLFAAVHVLDGDGAVCHFCFAYDGNVGNAVTVGVSHLFFHFSGFGVKFR